MLIFFWFIFRFLLLATIVALIFIAVRSNKNSSLKNSLKILLSGLKEGLKGSGLIAPKQKPRYPVELYVWVPMDDENTCEECLERATWPPMDIADWMKHGLPGTKEADCCCENCHCELVLIKSNHKISDHFNS